MWEGPLLRWNRRVFFFQTRDFCTWSTFSSTTGVHTTIATSSQCTTKHQKLDPEDRQCGTLTVALAEYMCVQRHNKKPARKNYLQSVPLIVLWHAHYPIVNHQHSTHTQYVHEVCNPNPICRAAHPCAIDWGFTEHIPLHISLIL